MPASAISIRIMSHRSVIVGALHDSFFSLFFTVSVQVAFLWFLHK